MVRGIGSAQCAKTRSAMIVRNFRELGARGGLGRESIFALPRELASPHDSSSAAVLGPDAGRLGEQTPAGDDQVPAGGEPVNETAPSKPSSAGSAFK